MTSPEHIKYRRMSFEPNVPYELFNKRERKLLSDYGAWLAALMHGLISPETEAQKHFVMVCKGKAEITTGFEEVWVLYIKRKLWEFENPAGRQTENTFLADIGIQGQGWEEYKHFREILLSN